ATGTPSFGALGVTVSGGLTPTVSAASINGNVATWTGTIKSSAAGTLTVSATDTGTMGGVAVTRATGDGKSGDSPSAVKNYVDANIQITPLVVINLINTAATLFPSATLFRSATGTPSFGALGVTVSPLLTPTVSGPSINGNVAT